MARSTDKVPRVPRQLLARLRVRLADLVPDVAASRLFVDDAGLNAVAIAFSPAAATNWHAILAQANVQEGIVSVARLLAAVRLSYPEDLELQDIEREMAPSNRTEVTGGRLRSTSRGGDPQAVFAMVESRHLNPRFARLSRADLALYEPLLRAICPPAYPGATAQHTVLENLARFITESTHTFPLRIEGQPGTGKSTVLSLLYLHLRHANEGSPAVLPVYLNIRRYDSVVHSDDGPPSAEARQRLRDDLDPVLAAMQSRPRLPIVLLLDGVDEYVRFRQSLEEELLSLIRAAGEGKKIVGVGLDVQSHPAKLRRPLLHLEHPEQALQLKALEVADAQPLVSALLQLRPNVAGDRERRVLEAIARCRLAVIDLLTVSLIDSRLDDPKFAEAPGIATLLRLDCEEFLRQRATPQAQTTVRAASELAHRYAILQDALPRAELLKNPGWALVHRHETIRNFLVANHVVELIREMEATVRAPRKLQRVGLKHVPDSLGFVYPEQINRFCKEIVNSSPDNQHAVLTVASALLDAAAKKTASAARARQALPQLLYIAGRLENASLREGAQALLQRAKETLVTRTRGEEDPLLARTIYISLAHLNAADATEEYLETLITNQQADELNRGFHLKYYGDAEYLPDEQLSYVDALEPFPRTFETLMRHLQSERSQSQLRTLRYIEFYTLLSLAQHRHARGWLPGPARMRLRSLITEFLKADFLGSPRLRDYAEMVARNFEQPSFPIVRVAQWAYRVKAEKRRGWVLEGLADIESVAAHMYGAYLLGWLYLDDKNGDGYDKGHILEMLLLHDLGEAETGDRSPEERTEQSNQKEREAFEYLAMLATYDGVYGPKKAKVLWEEFEHGSGIDARIARDLDKLDNLMQLYVYRLEGRPLAPERVQAWRADLLGKVETKPGRRIAEAIEVLWHSESQGNV